MDYGKFLICEYCNNTIVKAIKYARHLYKQHNLKLNDDFDLSQKINNDRLKIEERQNKAQFIRYNIKVKESLRTLEHQRCQDINVKSKTVYLIWDNIEFGKDLLKFKVTSTTIKPIEVKGVIESLNQIKKEYFERLYSSIVYKMLVYKGQIIVERSPGWNKLLEAIVVAREFHHYKSIKANCLRYSRSIEILSNKQIVSLFEKSFIKSCFLKYLALNQGEEFKIIPVIEFINNHKEESFLFRKNAKSGKLLIIWENINEGRATHIFKALNQRDILELLVNFILTNDMEMKRAIFYSSTPNALEIKNKLGFVKSIRHNTVSEYKTEIEVLINTN